MAAPNWREKRACTLPVGPHAIFPHAKWVVRPLATTLTSVKPCSVWAPNGPDSQSWGNQVPGPTPRASATARHSPPCIAAAQQLCSTPPNSCTYPYLGTPMSLADFAARDPSILSVIPAKVADHPQSDFPTPARPCQLAGMTIPPMQATFRPARPGTGRAGLEDNPAHGWEPEAWTSTTPAFRAGRSAWPSIAPTPGICWTAFPLDRRSARL